MITEDYVSFETSKLLKEKGFDEETRGYYPIKGDATGRLMFGIEYDHNHSQVQISAPTLQMAMKWLREVHNLHINIFVTLRDKIPHYQWSIDNLITQDTICDTPCLEKYEEACEAAIKYCLEKLI